MIVPLQSLGEEQLLAAQQEVRRQAHELLRLQEEIDRQSQALRDAEQFAQSTLDALPVHLCVLDEDGVILAKNNAWSRFSKAGPPTSSRANVGLNYLELCDTVDGPSAADAMLFAAGIRAVLHGECNDYALEYACHSPTEQRWFRGRVTRFPNSEKVRLVVVFENVTGRKQAEEKLTASEVRYRTLFEYAPDGIVIVNPQHYCIDANASMCQMLGYDRAEMIGLPASKFVAQSEVDHMGSAVRAIEAKAEYHREWPFQRMDGSVFKAEVIATLMPDGNLLGMVRDITERKQGEDALRASEERFRQLAENVNEVFWISNPKTNGMLYVSPAFEKIWGRSCESLYHAPQTWMDSVHPEDREQVRKAALSKQNSGEYDETYRILRPDGSVRWIHDRAYPVRDAAGAVFRVVGTASDITVNRNLEQQFRQSQKMEAFGLLAGGVAHDFNNLLSVVIGYCDLWLIKLPEDAPVRNPLQTIKKAGERAAALTTQLLAFSRQSVLERKVLNLNTVVRETEKMLGRLIGEDIQLTSILDPAIPLTKVDPGQIGQVLTNLVINARDAMPQGGKLTIQTGTVDFDEAYVRTHPGAQPGRQVMLAISDAGCGMTPETMARAFEPFFTTKEIGKGTGLGLAVVHGVVTQSGGTIQIESKVGIGTKFKLYFPMTTEVVSPECKSADIVSHAGTETVLVVEDETSLRDLIEECLQSCGYRVLTARTGPQALVLISREAAKINLMITDVVMPGMSGRELADTVQRQAPELKILFMSGYTDDSVVRHGIDHETVAFLQKPFTPFELLRKARAVLDRR